MSYNAEIEKMIVDAGATGPRITEAHIKGKIKDELYSEFGAGGLTICVITLRNGFSFIGHSAPADPSNYRKEIGRKIAYDNAFRQIWSHEGYLLKEVLYQAALMKQEGVAANEGMQQGGHINADPSDTQAAMGDKARE